MTLNNKSIDESCSGYKPNFDEIPCENVADLSETEEDITVSSDLDKIINQEKKQIKPYKEDLKIVNVGTEEKRRELKIRVALLLEQKHALIVLLKEY